MCNAQVPGLHDETLLYLHISYTCFDAGDGRDSGRFGLFPVGTSGCE